MNPQPLASEVETRYRTKSGADYLAYERANEKNFLNLQESALSDAGFAAIERRLLASGTAPLVLDIGCATGALLETLRARGWDARGVEICLPSAEYARSVRGLPIYSRPLAENRLPTGLFDAVIASHLIEHLNDPAGFVRESFRILKTGGYFLLTTPNIAGFQARVFRHKWRSAIFDHLYLFSVNTLSKLLTASGFTVEQVVTWGGLASGIAPTPIKRLFDKAAKTFGFGDVMLLKALRPAQPPQPPASLRLF
jgi:2-polyprenyl-3-methyl-5-hydroxy-6-metoxy-1,4-benzoquinol methylase